MNPSGFRTRARAIAGRFIPILSLACVVVGFIIAVTGVQDARAHNDVLYRLDCWRTKFEMVTAGWKPEKLLPCSQVPPAVGMLYGERDIWTSIVLGGYVALFGGIVFTLTARWNRRRSAPRVREHAGAWPIPDHHGGASAMARSEYPAQ
jgi:hypothetical protein